MDAEKLKKMMTERDALSKRATVLNDRIGRARKAHAELVLELKERGVDVEGKTVEEQEKLAIAALEKTKADMADAEARAQTLMEVIGEK